MTQAAAIAWVERLTVATLALAVLHRRATRLRILAGEMTPAADRLLGWLARLTGGRISGAVCTPQLAAADADGHALAYRLERWLLALSQAFAVGPAPAGLTEDEFHRLLGSYFIAKNRDAVASVCAASGHFADVESLHCYVAFPALGRFTATRLAPLLPANMRVVAVPSLRALAEGMRLLPGSPRHMLQWLRGGHAAAAVTPQAVERGVVLEQGYHRSIRQYPEAGHMYWVDGSGLAPEQVVLYCDRPDTPADAALQQAAAGHGWGWIDGANPLLMLTAPWHAIATALRAANPLLPCLPGSARGLRWVLAVSCRIQIDAYRALLRRYNVAAIHHFTEFAPPTVALCLAARRENAITVWNLWSVIPYLVARYRWALADLVLTWGPNDTGYHLASGFDCEAIAQVGVMDSDGTAASDEPQAQALRQRLSPAVSFVVAAFDTSYGTLVPNSGAQVATYLEAVIGLVESHPHWGLLIKPKKLGAEAAPDSIDGRLNRLAEQGRCLLLEPTAKIAEVALAADVVTGYPINTAATLGALRGRPLVQLDLSAMPHIPLLESGLAEGIVHLSAESFREALEALAERRRSLGDTRVWQPHLDPWGDGQGRVRAAALFGTYVRHRRHHCAREALAQALAAYGEEVGDAYIHRRGQSDNSPWHAVRRQVMIAAPRDRG